MIRVGLFRVPKAVNDVRCRASARKKGAGIWRRTYGADFCSRFLERVSGALVGYMTTRHRVEVYGRV